MKAHYPGEGHEVTEWAIRWTSPEDIADTITVMSSYAQAAQMLGLSFGQEGEVVYRRVTYSDWRNQ